NPFNAGSVLPKILHLKDHEPAHFTQTKQVLLGAKDFIIFRLTGSAVCDPTTAATTGMYDFDHGHWANAWMADLQLDTIRLPALHAAGEVVGQVHGAAAQATGLPQDLQVMCGLGDAAATTLGAGMTHASQSYAYLGTSGWVATLAQDVHRGDMPFFLLPYPEPGWHIRIGPISNAGSVHRWALQFTAKETEAQAYAELESLVASTTTDPDLVFLPYLSPERLPVMTDKPQGSFVGLSLQTNRADMLRAVLEGVALSLYWACEEVQTTTAEKLLVVGGATRSAAWMQILADVWDKPVIAHLDSTYLACLGAAATAAVSLGWAASTSVFLKAASQATAQCCTPNPDQVQRLAIKSQHLKEIAMRLILRSMGLVMAWVSMSLAQAAGGACNPVSSDEALKAEDVRYAAQMNNDFAAMEKLFSSDLVYIHTSSVLDNKASYIESMRSGTVKYKVMRRSDVTVRTYGCVAIINGMGNYDVRVKENDMNVVLRFTSIWQKKDNALEFISWQSTRVP
ncbi:MAG: DUF4440 domain-containing protein, partial [Betaproteobacteria bacterium]|nr:DUF4440 domain-containing protein [Betaproteobacteria bacterium]